MPLFLPTLAIAAASLLGAVMPAGAAQAAPAPAAATRTVDFSQCGGISWAGVLSPTTVHEARPEVSGIATAGSRLTFRDTLGNVYGTALAGDDWQFQLRFDRDLEPGFTQLVIFEETGTGCGFAPVGFTRA